MVHRYRASWRLRPASGRSKRPFHGEVSHTYMPRQFEPVENYLKRQGRFRHLFEPKRDDETIAHIQATVNEYWIAALKSKISTEVEASLHNDPARADCRA